MVIDREDTVNIEDGVVKAVLLRVPSVHSDDKAQGGSGKHTS